MKKIILIAAGYALTALLLQHCNSIEGKAANVSFYDVPLVCGADRTIGCGSRIKPLFLESAKHKEIKESWTNRQGTVIAFRWADKPDDELAGKLFSRFDIDASLIKDEKEIAELAEGMKGKEQWYEGMAIDSLSLHEAGTIANTLTNMAGESGLLSDAELESVEKDVEAYYKTELVKVRSTSDLVSAETRDKWYTDVFNILASHVGQRRAKEVADFVNEKQMSKEREEPPKKSCCDKDKKKGC